MLDIAKTSSLIRFRGTSIESALFPRMFFSYKVSGILITLLWVKSLKTGGGHFFCYDGPM